MADNMVLPGMEEFLGSKAEEKLDGHDGKPRSDVSYFDAASLPDAPGRQAVAHGAQTYIMYVVFPSFEEMRHGLEVLSGGNRKTIAKQATMSTINSTSIHKISGDTLIEFWEKNLTEAGKRAKALARELENADPEEALPPIFEEGDDSSEEKPEKPIRKVRTIAAEIPVVTEYLGGLQCTDENVVTVFPTYRRASTVKTWRHFPKGFAKACVEPNEINTYLQLNEGQYIFALPENSMSISAKRKWLIDNSLPTSARWLFMLEDDLTGFFVRDGLTAGGSHKLVKSDYKKVMDDMLNFAQANKIAELALSQQQSNHFYEEPFVKYSCKATEFCLFDLEILRSTNVNYDPEITQFEDFDISIQLLQKGEKVGLYTPAAFGHVTMGTNTGGHQVDGSRKERTVASIEKMITKYPGIIQIKEGRLFPEPKIDWTSLRGEIKR
jgi:hypothetical protein